MAIIDVASGQTITTCLSVCVFLRRGGSVLLATDSQNKQRVSEAAMVPCGCIGEKKRKR